MAQLGWAPVTPPQYIIASRDSKHWLGRDGQWAPDRLNAERFTEEQARIITANTPTGSDAWKV